MYSSNNWKVVSDEEPEDVRDAEIALLVNTPGRTSRSAIRKKQNSGVVDQVNTTSKSNKGNKTSTNVKKKPVKEKKEVPVKRSLFLEEDQNIRRSSRLRTPSRACSEAASTSSLPATRIGRSTRSNSKCTSKALSEISDNFNDSDYSDCDLDQTLSKLEELKFTSPAKSYKNNKRAKEISTPKKTPKKRKATEHSVSTTAKVGLKTPKRVSKVDGEASPKKRLTKTPKATRYTLRHVNLIRQELNSEESSSEEDSEQDAKDKNYHLNEEEEEIYESQEENKENNNPATSKFDHTDKYFNAMKTSAKNNSSKNDMSGLSKLDAYEITREDGFDLGYHDDIHNDNVSKFEEMLYYMLRNVNILLYGFGSKFKLLQDFIKTKYLEEAYVLEINCFTNGPTITGVSILKELLCHLLEVVEKVPRNPQLQIDLLNSLFFHKRDAQFQKNKMKSMDSNSEASQLSSPEKREIGLSSSKKVEEQIFIVVHNLELLPKTKTNQDSYICCMPHTYSALGVLSRLVQYDNIHLIASVDSINSGMIFNSNLLSYFNFLNFRTSNPYSKYNLEIRCMGFTRDNSSGGILVNAVVSIYHSLTKNAQKIFEIIVKYHLDQISHIQAQVSTVSSEIGIDIDDLYKKAKKSFLVNNLQTLKNLLVEFKDHKLIYSDSSQSQVERIVLKIDGKVMEDFRGIVGF